VLDLPGEPDKCWITQNLGATNQATSQSDNTEAAAGWYWRFNNKQGFKYDGTTRTPSTSWISSISETSDWLSANDPCTIEMGTGWRIPTYSEWNTVNNAKGLREEQGWSTTFTFMRRDLSLPVTCNMSDPTDFTGAAPEIRPPTLWL
jgi:hypothetical protein